MKWLKIIWWKRPEDIPADWEVHNATRPIYGTKEWTGDFVRGPFYAALDPKDEKYEWMRERNTDLDATRLFEATEEEAVAEMVAYYEIRDPRILAEYPPIEHREDYVKTWYSLELNRGD